MRQNHNAVSSTTRRQFLAATGAVLAAGGLPFQRQITAGGSAKYRRKNLSDPSNARNLVSYERGIMAMLALPPTDPRNWYRYALIHLIDCPHRNWWFLPWHRGYIGWLEAIIRELSRDSNFALPYWDWTALPRLPQPFLNGNLNPANFPLPGFREFKAQFQQPFQDYWNSLNANQLAQLKTRNYPDPNSVWASIEHFGAEPGLASIFSGIEHVRQLNPPNPPDFSQVAAAAVNISTIHDALMPPQFVDFGSGKGDNHHQNGQEGLLESQPHDMVHGEVGGGDPTSYLGFMSAFLSPVDPIFFMHHANLDRLWDVWTRRQKALGKPTTPTGDDLDTWNKEPFLFFIGSDGKFVSQTKSGDYTAMSLFDYDYQPGSGEDVVPVRVARSFEAAMESTDAKIAQPSVAMVKLPAGIAQAATREGGARVVVEITAEFPPNSAGTQLHVLVNVPKGKRFVNYTDPHYAGTYRPFALHHHGGMAHGPHTVTFHIGLTNSIRKLAAAKLLNADEPIKVSVVPGLPGVALEANVKITSVKLKTY